MIFQFRSGCFAGFARLHGHEIALRSGSARRKAVGSRLDARSVLQILMSMAMDEEMPTARYKRKWAPPVPDISADSAPLRCAHRSSRKPDDVNATMPYQGEWFCVANDDWKSKGTFFSILFLFTLVETDGSDKLPTITFPAQ